MSSDQKRLNNYNQHECEICGKKYFKLKSQFWSLISAIIVIRVLLKKSLTRLNNLSLKIYRCHVCKMCFTRRFNFKHHAVVYTDVKSFKCDQCEKFFTRKSSLIRHKVIHNGIKKFN